MEDGALWQACDTQALHPVGMCNGADNHANIGTCVPQPHFHSWGPDWHSRGDDIGLSSLVDPEFDQLLNLPGGHQLLNLPSTTESQDLIVGSPKFAHHGQWGHTSMPSERFTPTPDIQELLYAQALGSTPLANPQLQQDYRNMHGPSLFDKPFSVPQSSGGGSISRATVQAQYVPPLVSNSLGMFTPELPGGTITNAGLGGVGNSNISLMHLPKRHLVPHMPSNRAPSVPASAPVDPLSSIGGGGSPTLRVFTPPPKNNVMLPSLSGSSIPRKLGVAGGEQPNMSTFNPGPYVGNVITAELQQRQEALGARRMWVDKPSNNHLSPSISFEQRPQSVMADSRFPKADVGESMAKWSSVQIGAMGRTGGEESGPVNVQQPETSRMKCPLPTSLPSAVSLNATDSPNTARKRPLWESESNNQGGLQGKKPMQKWPGMEGCSRLEVISAAAHNKVSQTTSSGRALGPALNTNLKPRARQGSANDPQSIAARVRRERISERLKVLQTLIPNGDKVDMVTMLEKAINYVQCLKLQIRMLNDDSLWPKALGALPNTLEELLELAGPELAGSQTEETGAKPKQSVEVLEEDPNSSPPTGGD